MPIASGIFCEVRIFPAIFSVKSSSPTEIQAVPSRPGSNTSNGAESPGNQFSAFTISLMPHE